MGHLSRWAYSKLFTKPFIIRLRVSILPFLFILLLFANNVAAQDKPVVVQLKWWNQFEFAGYYAASIKGFYKQYGLDVKLKPGDKNHSPAHEVMMGRATFGVSDCDLLINYSKGQPIVALGAIFQHSPYIIISTPSQGIHFPTDLIGKKIMASNEYGWQQMRAMFIREGIPFDSIYQLKQTWKATDLINGKADAMTANIGVEPYQLKTSGVDFTSIEPINYGIDFYSDILFTQKSVISNDPGMTENFRKATIEGWEYAMSHPGEIADYILTLPDVQRRGVTKAALLYEAKQIQALMAPDLVEIGHMNEGRWEHILEIYQRLKLVQPDVSLEDFLYNHEETYVHDIVKKIIYISVAILLAIAGIILYSLSLKRAVRNRTMELEREILQGNETREKLMISEERLDLATEAAGIGIWDWYVMENSIYLSSIWKKMLGYEPDELDDTLENFFNFIHPDDKEEVLLNETRHIEGSIERLQFICRMRTKSGVYKWILSISRAGVRNEHGRATRIIGIHLDVDDIKKKEVELNQLSQELLISNKELKQFAYITSHNLRSPVANLLMLMQLFKKDELSEKNKLLFEKTDFSIKQLNQTLEDLNEILSARFNKAEKDELVNFEEVLKEVEASISEEITNSGASISYDFSQAEKMFYSKKTLNSIFLNLLTNAIKYAKPGTQPVIHLTTGQDRETITLKVKDEGIGIDLEKNAHKIFGLYQRFHNNTPGKGLGLYIIKNQVEAQNGTIEVDSAPGEGAVFTVNFTKIEGSDDEGANNRFVGG